MVLQDNEAINLAGSVSDVLPALVISLLLAGYGRIVWRRTGATAEPAGHLGDHFGELSGAYTFRRRKSTTGDDHA